jgi:hypothetical protein
MLEEKYNRYALLNERLKVAKRELKELYDLGNVMFILNSPKNEKAEPLKCYVSNCSQKCHERKTTNDFSLLELIPFFKDLRNHHQTKK